MTVSGVRGVLEGHLVGGRRVVGLGSAARGPYGVVVVTFRHESSPCEGGARAPRPFGRDVTAQTGGGDGHHGVPCRRHEDLLRSWSSPSSKSESTKIGRASCRERVGQYV